MPPTPYAGNPNNYPASIPTLSGGDLPNTTNFNAPLEGLADRTANLHANVAVPTWKPSYVLQMAGSITPNCCAFDSTTLKFLVGGVNASPAAVLGTGRGDPLNWQ